MQTRLSSLGQLVGTRAEFDLDRTLLAVAHDGQLDALARLVLQHGAREVGRLLDFSAVDGRDPVARAQLRGGSRTVRGDHVDDRAVVVRVQRRGDAEVGALDVAAADQLRNDLVDGVDRDGDIERAYLGVSSTLDPDDDGDLRIDAD